MFTTSTKVETFNNRNGSINVQYTHRVDISSKHYTTETETYAIINEKCGRDSVDLDRQQLRDLFDILLMMKDKGQI